MDSIIEFLMNAEGLNDLGSMIKLFVFMIGIDGVIGTIYAILRGMKGR